MQRRLFHDWFFISIFIFKHEIWMCEVSGIGLVVRRISFISILRVSPVNQKKKKNNFSSMHTHSTHIYYVLLFRNWCIPWKNYYGRLARPPTKIGIFSFYPLMRRQFHLYSHFEFSRGKVSSSEQAKNRKFSNSWVHPFIIIIHILPFYQERNRLKIRGMVNQNFVE